VRGAREFKSVKYGRADFLVYQHQVTVDDICKGDSASNWSLGYMTYGKGMNIRAEMRLFEASLRATIPQWDDARGIFDRIKAKSLFNVLFDSSERNGKYWTTYEQSGASRYDWKPTTESILQLIDGSMHGNEYYMHEYKAASRIRHILDKPFFRKYIYNICLEIEQAYADPSNKPR
jgi:hypothetical protein